MSAVVLRAGGAEELPRTAAIAAVSLACAALALRSPGWTGAVVLVAALGVGLLASGRPSPSVGVAGWLGVTSVGTLAIAVVAATAPLLPLQRPGVVGIGLTVFAAFAEESLFRRSMFALLERWGSVFAVLASAAAFAVVHVPGYGWRALPLDLAAGVLFGWQRSATGSWTSPAATHAAANGMIWG